MEGAAIPPPVDLRQENIFIKFASEDGIDFGGVQREWLQLLASDFVSGKPIPLFRTSKSSQTLQIIPDYTPFRLAFPVMSSTPSSSSSSSASVDWHARLAQRFSFGLPDGASQRRKKPAAPPPRRSRRENASENEDENDEEENEKEEKDAAVLTVEVKDEREIRRLYFFAGIILGIAIGEGIPVDIHLARFVLRHIHGEAPHFADLEAVEPDVYKNLKWLLDHTITEDLGLTFTATVQHGSSSADSPSHAYAPSSSSSSSSSVSTSPTATPEPSEGIAMASTTTAATRSKEETPDRNHSSGEGKEQGAPPFSSFTSTSSRPSRGAGWASTRHGEGRRGADVDGATDAPEETSAGSSYSATATGGTHEIELIEGGKDKMVTEENKKQYIRCYCQYIMSHRVEGRLTALLMGLYRVVPRGLLQFFTVDELEILLSGAPEIDVDDLRSASTYEGYLPHSPPIRWFWEVVGGMTGEELGQLLHFATGCSRAPPGGFSGGGSGDVHGHTNVIGDGIGSSGRKSKGLLIMKAANPNLLPVAHTCFNRIDLPSYPSLKVLREKLMLAIQCGRYGFQIA